MVLIIIVEIYWRERLSLALMIEDKMSRYFSVWKSFTGIGEFKCPKCNESLEVGEWFYSEPFPGTFDVVCVNSECEHKFQIYLRPITSYEISVVK